MDILDKDLERENSNESENMEAQSICNTSSNLTNDTVFHAVYIPQNNNESLLDENKKECIRIHQDMQAALKVIKEFKKARLKTFRNRADAEAYAITGHEYPQFFGSYKTATVSANNVTEEKSTSLKPQDLVSFRKLIENGDLESVKNTVRTNTRYLISSGDTPAILHMGYRYNALHVAVKADKPKICEFILNTVGNPDFMRIHYECYEYGYKSYLDPASIMLDLYLNTPDKGLNETPLHFAAKFGLKDVVRVLVSYSQCIKTLPNKYQQLPIDIICSRKCQEDEDLKREIRMLLEDQFYVPVLRSEGNTFQPTIGEPFSPTSPLNLNRDPISPRVEVRAFAGPMTKSQALEFRRKWKTPPRTVSSSAKKEQGDACSITNSPSADITMRLKDTEKGLERVGRDLAERYQVPWKEYWPFLNDFVDFRSDEGLTKLEKYLKQKFEDYLYESSLLLFCMLMPRDSVKKKVNTDVMENCEIDAKETDVINEIQDLCDELDVCSLNTKHETEENIEFFTPPSSPEPIDSDSDDMQNAEEEGPKIFIEGSSPTKLDYAVYNALSSVITPHGYPNIYRWRHDIQLILKRDPCRFNEMKPLRRKLFTNI